MEGIHFVTDENGHKIAVHIDLGRYGELWEDFYDALTIEQRRNDERISLREVRKRLARCVADYEVVVSRRAADEIDDLPKPIALRVYEKLEALGYEPRPRGVKKLRGSAKGMAHSRRRLPWAL